MAIGIWAAAGALALATGPALGGLISQHLHWGWIFLINVPVGVLTFVITMIYVAESRSESAVRQLDLPGLATSALALFALTYALIEGNVSGWTAPRILGAFALAAASAGAFLAIESRSAHPMVDLKMFRSREFSGGSGTMMIWAFSSSLRKRAAHEAPPAEPPMMMTFMTLPSGGPVSNRSPRSRPR